MVLASTNPSSPANCLSGRIAISVPPPFTQLLIEVTCAEVKAVGARIATSYCANVPFVTEETLPRAYSFNPSVRYHLLIILAERIGRIGQDEYRAALRGWCRKHCAAKQCQQQCMPGESPPFRALVEIGHIASVYVLGNYKTAQFAQGEINRAAASQPAKCALNRFKYDLL